MKLKYILILCPALLFSGCDNANLGVQLSPATSEANFHKGVTIYAGYDYKIQRVNINGVNYLCNSNGGIIRE